MILAEFYGGPMHGQSKTIPFPPFTLACCRSEYSCICEVGPPTIVPGTVVVDYVCWLRLPDRAVYIVSDENSAELNRYAKLFGSRLMGYFQFTESEFINRAMSTKAFNIELKRLELDFFVELRDFVQRRIDRKRGASTPAAEGL